MHRFQHSAILCRHLESQRVKEKWPTGRGDVHGIVEANDSMMLKGSISVDGKTWQLPEVLAEAIEVPPRPDLEHSAPLFDVTDVCCANIDTLSAALVLGDACALNFASGDIPGGRYRSGGLAQEEDLCRLLPQLYPSLKSSQYPIPPGVALLTRGLECVRRPGSYVTCPALGTVTIISAAMPIGPDRRPKGGWASSDWAESVTLRIRSVLHAAKHSGHANLILGAFGCGAFGNPTRPVAALFREQLMSREFRGTFAKVVFAIIDPVGTGNLKPFREEIAQIRQDQVSLGTVCEHVVELEEGKGSFEFAERQKYQESF